LEQLAALGYATARRAVTTLPDPLEPTELPDPRTRKDELARIYRALERAEQGKLAEAIELLSAVVSENPLNPSARQYLADYLVAAGECPRAVPLLESLVAMGAERASTHLNLGFCLAQDDRNEEAVAHFKRAHELDAGSAAALSNLVVVLKRLGRLTEAAEYRRLYEALRAP
jgi:tetratricopeptide (TPR) repeat protein